MTMKGMIIKMNYDVVIIGAGVVGAMTAHFMSHYELNICVVERCEDIAMGASCANSGIVHAGFDAKSGSLKAKLNVEGSKMMEQICSELDVNYRKNGSIVLGFSEADREKLCTLLQNGKENGVEGLRILNRDELTELEPNVSDKALCALYAPSGAIVCPYGLTEAAMGNAMDNGTELKLGFEVKKINKTDYGYELISANGEKISGSIVVNAAGIYSDDIANMIEDTSFKVHPRRGEYVLLDKECGEQVNCTIFTVPTEAGKGILVSPTVDKNLLIGPTSVDYEDKEDKKTTAIGIANVTDGAKRMVKDIDMRMAITSFCGLRAAGDTGDFIINMPQKGFVNVAGIESPGLSASPAIAKYVIRLIEDEGYVFKEKKNYIKERKSIRNFKNWTIKQKNEIIKKDASFGNIICRCENITEGEIRYAMRKNPKPTNMDAVKRRTRAQMGRCQGGFCSPHVIQIIADELGIPAEQVTKNSENSYIISGFTKEM